MQKCPYCAEEIKKEARICKHCKKDLTTKEAKSLIEEDDLRFLKEETKDKLGLYPKRLLFLKNTTQRKFLEKIDSMNKKEIKEDIFKKTRKQNILLLWVISFISMFIFPYIIILTVWLHPSKDEKRIFKNRFNKFKSKKLRIVFSFFALLFAIIFHSGQLGIEEALRINEEREEEVQKQERKTIMDVDFGLEYDFTKKESLNFVVEMNEIDELYINGEVLNTDGQDKFEHTIDLKMGNNKINIVGHNNINITGFNDIKRRVTKNIKRVNNEEYETLIQEKREKTEEKKAKQTNIEVEIPNYVLLDKVEHISTRRYQDKAIYFGDVLIKKELNEIKNPEEFSKIAKKIVEEENLKKSASFYTTKEAYKANYNSTIKNADSFLHEGYIGTFEDGKFTTLQSSKYFKLHNTN